MDLIQTPKFNRDLKSGEEADVDRLLSLGFGDDRQSTLVRKMRKSGMIAGETVMPMGDQIVGYYALSYMKQPKKWLFLSPVVIAPDMQGRGYGKRMLGILTEWARLTQTPILTTGPAGFLTKTGFAETAQLTPHGAPVFMAGGSVAAMSQTFVYHAALDSL